jgi:hypothetical protein
MGDYNFDMRVTAVITSKDANAEASARFTHVPARSGQPYSY